MLFWYLEICLECHSTTCTFIEWTFLCFLMLAWRAYWWTPDRQLSAIVLCPSEVLLKGCVSYVCTLTNWCLSFLSGGEGWPWLPWPSWNCKYIVWMYYLCISCFHPSPAVCAGAVHTDAVLFVSSRLSVTLVQIELDRKAIVDSQDSLGRRVKVDCLVNICFYFMHG